MNWIEYAKEKPRGPSRLILLHWQADGRDLYDTIDSALSNHAVSPQHWAEIETPGTVERERTCFDPFEEWWKRNNGDSFLVSESTKPYFRTGWDAAIKWKEGK